MPKRRYSTFELWNQKFASTQLGSWVYARTLHRMDRIFLTLTRGRTTLSSVVSGMPETWVTVKGAKSGKPRTLPLVYIRDEANPTTFALIASNWGQEHNPAWYYNLKADPRAKCLFAGETREYVAHEATGEEYEKFWQLAAETWLGYPLYQRRASGRHIPIMVMSPAQEHRS